MNCVTPNYKELRFSNLKEPQYKHIFLLAYWPLYGFVFLYFERLRNVSVYHTVESSLDEFIPFVPEFIIPYFGWFVYLIGGLIFFFFTDVTTFKRSMWFIIITYSVTSLIYFVYPTQQLLRPDIQTQGFFETVVSGLYVFDTNTNVCPSIHVLGSMAICFPSLKCAKLRKGLLQFLTIVLALLISFSTVFLKQHSIIDVFWAFLLSFAAYPFCIADNKLSRKLLNFI